MIGKYLTHMLVVVAILALGGFALFGQLEQAFLSNMYINGGILGVLLLGILLSFLQVLRLGQEWKWIEYTRLKLRHLGEGDDSAKAAPGAAFTGKPALLAPLANMLEERERISGDVRLSPASMKYLLDSVSLRLEENSDLLRYFVGLLVFIGLLGTFWGLMETLASIGQVIQTFSLDKNDIVQSIENIRAGLTAPIGGMSTAFSSSLFGLGGSLILGLLSLFCNQAQNRFHNELEEWFSSMTRLGSVTGTDGGDHPVYVQSLLEHTADTLDKLGWNMQQSSTQQKQTLERLDTLNTNLSRLSETSDQSQMIRQLLQAQHKLEMTLHKDRQEMTENLREELRLLGRVFAGQSKPKDPNTEG